MGETDTQFVTRVMQRWIDLVAARDLDGLEEFFDSFYTDDATLDPGIDDEVGSVRVLLDWARMAFLTWEAGEVQAHYEMLEVVDAGGGIAVPIRSQTTIEDQLMEAGFTYLVRLRDGKIASMAMYTTVEQALAAAGESSG